MNKFNIYPYWTSTGKNLYSFSFLDPGDIHCSARFHHGKITKIKLRLFFDLSNQFKFKIRVLFENNVFFDIDRDEFLLKNMEHLMEII